MLHVQLLVGSHPIISDQIKKPALSVVLAECEKILASDIAGSVVEFGCYKGTTSLFIRRLLNAYQDDRDFHVYDSFEGLPTKKPQDASAAGVDFVAGELNVSRRELLREFDRAHLIPPTIHKAWFADLTERDVPAEISFAFLDGDFYSSIIDSLRLVWPRLVSGGTITIDDYQKETLPGVERAVRDFFQGKKISKISVSHNIAVIRKNT